MKLDSGKIHLLNLVVIGKGLDGWTPVSAPVFPLIKNMPRELVELEATEVGGRARLTREGNNLIAAMEWLP